jgi:putative phosphoesterase
MIIGIISDTHDRIANIDTALTMFKLYSVKHIIHCGDWKSPETLSYFADQAAKLNIPVSGVLGNNDLDINAFSLLTQSYPDIDVREGVFELSIDDKKTAIYHGHHAPTLRRVLANESYDIVFLGHTHKPRIETVSNTLIINPGSTAFSIPRSKQWKPSVVLLDTKTMNAEFINLE